MEITEVAHALSSKTRVRLLHIVSKESVSSSDAHKRYQAEYNSPTRRESIYRELENLVDAGLVKKEYQSDEKSLTYTATSKEICFDISKLEVEM